MCVCGLYRCIDSVCVIRRTKERKMARGMIVCVTSSVRGGRFVFCVWGGCFFRCVCSREGMHICIHDMCMDCIDSRESRSRPV